MSFVLPAHEHRLLTFDSVHLRYLKDNIIEDEHEDDYEERQHSRPLTRQRPVNIRDDVIRIFDAHRQAQRVIGNSQFGSLGR